MQYSQLINFNLKRNGKQKFRENSSRQVSDENRWREPKSRYERNFLSKDCIEAVCETDRIRVVSEEEKEYRSTVGNERRLEDERKQDSGFWRKKK